MTAGTEAHLAGVGIALRHYRPGEHRAPCPECNRGPKDDALAVRLEPDGAATWLCHRCTWKGGIAADQGAAGPARRVSPRPRPAEREQTAEAVVGQFMRLWRAGQAIADSDPAGRYLAARGCRLPPVDGDLRWLDDHPHPSGWRGPALLALLTDAITGEPATLHRTWIMSDGCKAAVDKPRLLWPGARKAGAVCRLWPDDAVTLGLALAEGIETALAAARGFRPIWATIDAGNLTEFPVLDGIEGLMVFGDSDRPNPKTGRRAGSEAAAACARRWRAAGVEVRVFLPRVEGTDVADLAAESRP